MTILPLVVSSFLNSTGLPKIRCDQIKRHLIPEQKPLLLLLNETNLTEKSDRKLEDVLVLDLDKLGYRHISKFKPTKSGGGVSIVFRDNLSVTEVSTPKQFSDLQAIVIKVKGDYINEYTIATYYNSPKLTLNIEFLYWLSQYENAILMSDLNSKHPSLNCIRKNKNGNLLVSALESDSNPLELMILNDKTMTKRPFRKNEVAELLDMVFCHPKLRPLLGEFNVGPDYGSQHSSVSIQIPLKYKPKKVYPPKPDFKKYRTAMYQTPPGTLWYTLVHSDTLWYALAHSGIIWYTLIYSGIL